MDDIKIAVVGIGATGAVLAASLLSRYPETICVGSRPGMGEVLVKNGIRISGAISYQVPVHQFVARVRDLKDSRPDIVFISTKTFHIHDVLEDLADVFKPGMKIISTQNGLGPEDVIAEKFGAEAAFRMSLNYGVASRAPGQVETAFFNKPNYLGGLSKENQALGQKIAEMLTLGGLDTTYVDDIKLQVWKKMILKCSLSAVCAVTDRTIQEVSDFPPTRELLDACFRESVAVARATGCNLGDDAIEKAVAYMSGMGAHKDSMCQDIANKAPTEIDFLGGKVVEYGRAHGVPTPYFIALTNLVKSIEDRYSKS